MTRRKVYDYSEDDMGVKWIEKTLAPDQTPRTMLFVRGFCLAVRIPDVAATGNLKILRLKTKCPLNKPRLSVEPVTDEGPPTN